MMYSAMDLTRTNDILFQINHSSKSFDIGFFLKSDMSAPFQVFTIWRYEADDIECLVAFCEKDRWQAFFHKDGKAFARFFMSPMSRAENILNEYQSWKGNS